MSATAGAAAVANRGLITLAVMLASGMYALDWTIAAVALPHMQGTFSATQDQISWVLTSYIVISAIMLPTTGWLSRRFGRKRLFLVSVGSFTMFSLACGSADSMAAEVAFRIGQGLSGAYLIPLSQSIMLDNYPVEQHAKAMAIWGFGVMLGPIIGPTVGGYLTEVSTWRWVFYINLPAGCIAFVLGWLWLPGELGDDKARSFDWFGFAALGLAIGALQMMLDRGQRLDWFQSPEIIIEATLACLGLYTFVVHSLTSPSPLVSLRLFKDRNYAIGLLIIFVYGLLTLAPIVLMPQLLHDLRDYPITIIGLLLSPRGAGLMLSMMILGRLGARIDPRIPVGFGFAMLAFSSWVMAGWNLEVGMWDVAWTGALQGLGAGAIVLPMSTLTYSTLDPAYRTEAAAVWNLIRSVGSSAGISIALVILVRMSATSRAYLAEHLTPFNELLAFHGLAGRLHALDARLAGQLDLEILRQSAMIGYLDVFYVAAIASALAMPLILLLRQPPPASDAGS